MRQAVLSHTFLRPHVPALSPPPSTSLQLPQDGGIQGARPFFFFFVFPSTPQRVRVVHYRGASNRDRGTWGRVWAGWSGPRDVLARVLAWSWLQARVRRVRRPRSKDQGHGPRTRTSKDQGTKDNRTRTRTRGQGQGGPRDQGTKDNRTRARTRGQGPHACTGSSTPHMHHNHTHAAIHTVVPQWSSGGRAAPRSSSALLWTRAIDRVARKHRNASALSTAFLRFLFPPSLFFFSFTLFLGWRCDARPLKTRRCRPSFAR